MFVHDVAIRTIYRASFVAKCSAFATLLVGTQPTYYKPMG